VRRRPAALLRGSAAVLHVLAAALGADTWSSRPPKAVVSSGETLTVEARAAIEARFETAVFDSYGSREFDALAQQCEVRGGYHINAESFIVEVVRDGRPARDGEEGDVLVTDLSNFCVPLIRYAIGDRAVAADRPCACGRGLPLLGSVRGRAAAVFVGREGHVVPAEFFFDVLRDYGHVVRRFQVVQSQPGAVELRIVKSPRYSARALQQLLEVFRRYLGTHLSVDVEPIDSIPSADDGTAMPVLSLAAGRDVGQRGIAGAAGGGSPL
jgi:phenylacetate-CoA ligase